MKSRETSLSSSTTANGPKSTGGVRPSTSARNAAEACRSCAATMVWFSWTDIAAPLSSCSDEVPVGARRRPGRAGPGVVPVVEQRRQLGAAPDAGLAVEAAQVVADGVLAAARPPGDLPPRRALQQ